MRRLFLLVCMGLAACTTLTEGPLSDRNYQSTISMAGRLSVRYQQGGQPQSLQGKFRWQQQGEQTNITLYSPLGQTIATIEITPGLAVLAQSDGEKRQAPNVTTLTQEVLGWPMPVDGLRYWLQGFVQDANGKLDMASPESTHSFQSDGWRVRYVSWQRNASIQYPKRFDMERTTVEAGDIVLRLVIDEWNDR